MKVVLLLAFLVAFSFAQQLEEKFIIDDFSVTQQCIITLPGDLLGNQPNQVQTTTASGPSNSIIGGERNMEMRVFTGFQGRRFASEVFTINDGYFLGEWAVENPKTSSSLATNQYDGGDGSFAVNFNGLGLNLNEITQLVIYVVSDINTSYTVDFYDSAGVVCSGDIDVPGRLGGFYDYSYDEIKDTLLISQLSGNCNKANIGAIEVSIQSSDAIDAIVRRISLEGPVPPTPTPTPSPTGTSSPIPSNSATPTGTSTRTPSPSGPCIFFCTCPSFTCQIAYDADDDVNTLSYYTSAFVYDDSDDTGYIVYVDDDGNTSDDTIVYVYVQVDDDDGISFSISTGLTTFFSSFTSLFSTGFTTFFSTGFTTFFSTGFTSFFSTGFSSFNGSSSSDAVALGASALIVGVFALI